MTVWYKVLTRLKNKKKTSRSSKSRCKSWTPVLQRWFKSNLSRKNNPENSFIYYASIIACFPFAFIFYSYRRIITITKRLNASKKKKNCSSQQNEALNFLSGVTWCQVTWRHGITLHNDLKLWFLSLFIQVPTSPSGITVGEKQTIYRHSSTPSLWGITIQTRKKNKKHARTSNTVITNF